MSEKNTGIRVWEMWRDNWKNAKKFFESKGNAQTKIKLKGEWYKKFFLDLSDIGCCVLKDDEIKGGEV